jgi:hypothetical protein
MTNRPVAPATVIIRSPASGNIGFPKPRGNATAIVPAPGFAYEERNRR